MEHDYLMVILTLVHNFLVKWVLIDQESLANIPYSYMAKALGIPRSMYKSYNNMLSSFAGASVGRKNYGSSSNT